jgi:hypothetical protein
MLSIKDHEVYTHPCVLFELPQEDLHMTKRITIFSFYDPRVLTKLPFKLETMNWPSKNVPNI